jgi:hypothetical protein
MKIAPVQVLAHQSLQSDEIKLTQASAVLTENGASLQAVQDQGSSDSPRSSAEGDLARSGHAPSRWNMPSLIGLSPREALRAFKGHGFHVEVTGSGVISSQVPEAGKTLVEGDKIRLILNEP